MPNFWPDPSWPTRTEPAVYEDTPAEYDTEEPAQPPAPPELTLHLGADSVARPTDVPESLVAEWNRINDRIVYELALAGDAAGLPRDQADRRAAVTAGGAVAGTSVGANAAGFVAGLGGCFTGMLIGGVAGAAIGGIPTAGVAGPLGATIGGVGGCMVGAAVLGVPATVAGGVVGAIVGGAVAGAAGSGTSDAPPTDVAPAPEPEPSADVDPSCEGETQPGENDGVPVAAPLPDPASPLSPVDAFVSTVVTTAQAVWAQLTAPPVPEHIFKEG